MQTADQLEVYSLRFFIFQKSSVQIHLQFKVDLTVICVGV